MSTYVCVCVSLFVLSRPSLPPARRLQLDPHPLPHGTFSEGACRRARFERTAAAKATATATAAATATTTATAAAAGSDTGTGIGTGYVHTHTHSYTHVIRSNFGTLSLASCEQVPLPLLISLHHAAFVRSRGISLAYAVGEEGGAGDELGQFVGAVVVAGSDLLVCFVGFHACDPTDLARESRRTTAPSPADVRGARAERDGQAARGDRGAEGGAERDTGHG